MNSVHRIPPTDALGEVQFFAVPHHAVKDVQAQEDAWVWYSDALVDHALGFFQIRENGALVFKANNDPENKRYADAESKSSAR